ncbi:MAG TPA: hypothetical protein PLL98_11890 [Bacillota bacterium]|nr:hypothetical protein [Bacillota bacterium]HPL53820.1 hypothetical protein [Bacillota bacterium]
MKTRYIQVLKAFIALVITVASLCTGQAIWLNYAIDLPLDKALNEINGVEEVAWDNGNSINDTMNIFVKLGNTNSLQKTYIEINKEIEQILKGRQYTLNIKDNRSPELEQTYYEIHYYIQKAIADGDFPLLKEKVQEKTESMGAKSRLYVDEQNIYLQLTKNESSLYAVIARHSNQTGGSF